MASPSPLRSVLYVPGSNAKALGKARGLPCDALILDLEDSVLPAQKDEARRAIEEALSQAEWAPPIRVLRINGLDTPWAAEDLRLAAEAKVHAVLLPKIDGPLELRRADEALKARGASSALRLWSMIETPRAVLALEAIATATPRLEALVVGSNDLLKALHAKHTASRAALGYTLGRVVTVARALGLIALDGVHRKLFDPEGLAVACQEASALGFDGKTLIHPQEIEVANAAFSPSSEEIAEAERVVAAFSAAERAGRGVVVVDGKLVEALHFEEARSVLLRAGRVPSRDSDSAL